MERYYKISESELLELLENDIELRRLICAGADNWAGYGNGCFEEECAEAGFQEDEEEGYSIYSDRDLAKHYLKDFEKIT